ncbi:MAG: hypothetical protein EVA65_07930 [Oceanococcus sp.]|nr:MAG: hypothetical protein EVA65_07930 [Oceanococcus sp.]
MAADLSELKTRLGDAELGALAELDESDVARLCQLFDAAREHQATTLQQASEQALKHIPALLRPAVRKLLF